MTERPILFSSPMVRAILDGRKTQTRRLPPSQTEFSKRIRCPYSSGMKLWVRETWGRVSESKIAYRADAADDYQWGAGKPSQGSFRWKPSIFMPRALSRITLEITSVKLERLQEISEYDAKAEGAQREFEIDVATFVHGKNWDADKASTYRLGFKHLWDTINKKRAPWAINPFVWAITFKKL